MCCCEQPTVNGQPGYKWQPGDVPIVRQVSPPDTGDSKVIFDEPGRCGGLDSHCHHYRIAGNGHNAALYCRNGGGDSMFRLSNAPAVVAALSALDSNARYWLLNAMYHASQDSARTAGEETARRWATAAVEKRIRIRRTRGVRRVEIVPAAR